MLSAPRTRFWGASGTRLGDAGAPKDARGSTWGSLGVEFGSADPQFEANFVARSLEFELWMVRHVRIAPVSPRARTLCERPRVRLVFFWEVYGNSCGCSQIYGPTQAGELIWEPFLESGPKSRPSNTRLRYFFHKRIPSVNLYGCIDIKLNEIKCGSAPKYCT